MKTVSSLQNHKVWINQTTESILFKKALRNYEKQKGFSLCFPKCIGLQIGSERFAPIKSFESLRFYHQKLTQMMPLKLKVFSGFFGKPKTCDVLGFLKYYLPASVLLLAPQILANGESLNQFMYAGMWQSVLAFQTFVGVQTLYLSFDDQKKFEMQNANPKDFARYLQNSEMLMSAVDTSMLLGFLVLPFFSHYILSNHFEFAMRSLGMSSLLFGVGILNRWITNFDLRQNLQMELARIQNFLNQESPDFYAEDSF